MKNNLAAITFIFAAALLAGGCGKQNKIIKAHNQMVAIESTMADSYNSNTTADGHAAAVKTALDSLNRIDISKCPADYQRAWGELIDVWTQLHTAILANDIPTVNRLLEQSPVRVSTLNTVAKSHGIEMK